MLLSGSALTTQYAISNSPVTQEWDAAGFNAKSLNEE